MAEENDGVFSTSSKRPDIRITRPSPQPPFVIENEYSITKVEDDCLNKLGEILKPEYGGQTIHTVIGVYSGPELHDSDNGDVAEERLRCGAELKYVAYTGTSQNAIRFPNTGFVTGSIRNLVEFVRPASEPADLIQQAADTLAAGAEVASKVLLDVPGSDLGVAISEKLRQPWP
ncbi:MAG: hypothetical protein F4Y08_16220 [Caldilineaceae bacterium SB0662_bin_9]|uniref:Uncharacterized protein n=1 Tax=Caldilineaceae bacterium SB0662_bin_9 TaxID=2605258 RepID=A0A6B1DVX9_9CHLR|nr:hypothetical protein [Caldilineaceae bacterium SB0662_bin_9]